MPKPTLLQTIFNQPSRSYAFPTTRDLHSTKQDLLRIARDLQSADSDIQSQTSQINIARGHFPTSSQAGAGHQLPQDPAVGAKNNPRDTIAAPSPYAASDSIAQNGDAILPADGNGNPEEQESALHIRPSYAAHDRDLAIDSGDESDDENEIFYTPMTSPYSSPRTSNAVSDTALPLTGSMLSVQHRPLLRTRPPRPISPNRSSTTSYGSELTTSSMLTESQHQSDDNVSIYTASTLPPSVSTHVTTPLNSEAGQWFRPNGTVTGKSKGKGKSEGNVERSYTIASSRTGSFKSDNGSTKAVSPDSPRVAVNGASAIPSGTGTRIRTRHRRSHTVNGAPVASPPADRRQAVYVDQAWDRDVRWLAPSSSSSGYSSAEGHYNTVASGSGSGPGTGLRPSKTTGTVRKQMSALLEEDEESVNYESVRNSKGHVSRSSTVPNGRVRASSSPSPSPRQSLTSGSTTAVSHQVPSQQRHQQHRSSQSVPSASTSASNSTSTHSHSSSHSTVVASPPRVRTLPTPLPAPSTSAQNGYTTLVLPVAGKQSTKKDRMTVGDGKVDLTKSGMAQTTMLTVEVVKGVGAASDDRGRGPMARKGKRKLSFSLGRSSASQQKRTGKTPAHLLELDQGLALTSHLTPPGQVGSSEVLVQVWAVGLDGVDSLLVENEITSGGAGGVGYVPGRSVVGRAVEVGWAVSPDVVRRSEWVIAFMDVKKCGALAEFVVIDRHRVHRCPPPRSSPHPLSMSRTSSSSSSKSRSRSMSPSPSSPHSSVPFALSLAELALLPLCGIPALRAVRTFIGVIQRWTLNQTEGRPRALVLRGHDGAGAIAVQMLKKKGVQVIAYVPESADEDKLGEVERRLRRWGAEGICWGNSEGGGEREEAIRAIERLADDGEQFDMVLDTIGGRELWRACQPIFRQSGANKVGTTQFTTLVGDVTERAIPTAQDHFWAGLRSMGLKRGDSSSIKITGSPIKKEKEKGRKDVGYAWVSVASDVDYEGQDVKDSLAALLATTIEGVAKPWDGENEGKVLPFERAPEVFKRDEIGPQGLLKDGGTAVVKILG